MMTSLNLLSQQKADSDHEAEVSVQRIFNVCMCVWSLFQVTNIQYFIQSL